MGAFSASSTRPLLTPEALARASCQLCGSESGRTFQRFTLTRRVYRNGRPSTTASGGITLCARCVKSLKATSKPNRPRVRWADQ